MLRIYSFNELPPLRYQLSPPARDVEIKTFWSGNNFLSKPQFLPHALILENNDWYQLIYNANSAGEQAMIKLLDELPSDPTKVKFISAPKTIWPYIRQRWTELHFNSHYVISFPPQPVTQKFHFDRLRLTDLDYLVSQQKYIDEYGGKSYLKFRIQKNISVGLRKNGQLVCWAILHDDGSMGFLRVLENHRNQGIGAAASAFLVNQVCQVNQIPFAYISGYNKGSLGIVKRLNGDIKNEVSWVRMRSTEEIKSYEAGQF